jgi:hypothetical protein
MDINLTCLNFLPGTQIGEQYYHQLEYNRLDGMTYYRNVKLDPIIDKLIRNHKRIFLHCYNLHKNTYIEQKYLGYFFMILFNELYFTFYNEIEELVQTYKYNYVKLYEQLFKKAKSDIIALCDYVYNTYGIIEEKVISKIFKKILKKIL